MKKISNIIKHYFNKNLWIIYILGFVLSLVGSFQVYHGSYDSILKEICYFCFCFKVISLCSHRRFHKAKSSCL